VGAAEAGHEAGVSEQSVSWWKQILLSFGRDGLASGAKACKSSGMTGMEAENEDPLGPDLFVTNR